MFLLVQNGICVQKQMEMMRASLGSSSSIAVDIRLTFANCEYILKIYL